MKVGLHRAKQEAWGELRGTGCHTPGVKACPQNLRYPVGTSNTAPSPALSMAWQEQSGRVCAHSLEKGLVPGIAVQPGHASGRRSVPLFKDGWVGARLPGSTSGLSPCSHRLDSPLCITPQDAVS